MMVSREALIDGNDALELINNGIYPTEFDEDEDLLHAEEHAAKFISARPKDRRRVTFRTVPHYRDACR